MNGLLKKVKYCAIYISFQERKKREYKRYITEADQLRQLSDLELKLEEIRLKSMYEYKRNVLGLFLIAIILAVLTDVWKSFYKFIQHAMKYTSIPVENSFEIAKIGVFITAIVAIFVTLVLCIFLINYMKQLYALYRRILLIEMVKEEKGMMKDED